MTLPSVLGCQVCSALEKQNVPKDKVFFGAKCASAGSTGYSECMKSNVILFYFMNLI